MLLLFVCALCCCCFPVPYAACPLCLMLLVVYCLPAVSAAGPAPVFIGFGSLVVDNPERLTHRIMKAVMATKIRAIIQRGWGGLGAGLIVHEVPSNVMVIDACPHDWLFPRCSAVIHHGGAGTTASGLRFGKPTLVGGLWHASVVVFAGMLHTICLAYFKHNNVCGGFLCFHGPLLWLCFSLASILYVNVLAICCSSTVLCTMTAKLYAALLLSHLLLLQTCALLMLCWDT